MNTAHFDVQGQGHPVVLLHGFCESSAIWNPIIDILLQKNQVIRIDLPGFGENPALEKDLSIEDFAHEVHQVVEELELEEFCLVGHSLGGYVGLAYAELYPKTLSGMVLFHSTAKEDTTEKKENREKTIRFLEKHGIEPFLKSFVPTLFADSQIDFHQTEVEEVTDITRNTPVESAIYATRAMKNRKARLHVLETIGCPVLFICGREDNAVPLTSLWEQMQLPEEVVIHVLPHTGHLGMFEAPEACGRIVQGFLHRIG